MNGLHRYAFRRYELWGNEKDGFDCNNVYTVASEDIATTEETQERILRRWARDVFTGYGYAFSENRTGYLRRYGIEIEWTDEWTWAVLYRGTEVGCIELVPVRDNG